MLRPVLMLPPHVDVRRVFEVIAARDTVELLRCPLLAARAFVGSVHSDALYARVAVTMRSIVLSHAAVSISARSSMYGPM